MAPMPWGRIVCMKRTHRMISLRYQRGAVQWRHELGEVLIIVRTGDFK